MARDPRTIGNVSAATIQEILHTNLAIKARAGRLPPQVCPICTEKYLPTRRWQKFCSTTCRNKWHVAKRVEGT